MPLMVTMADTARFERRHGHLGGRIHTIDRRGGHHDIEVRDALLGRMVAGDSCVTITIDREGAFRMVRKLEHRSVGDGRARGWVWKELSAKCFGP